MKKHCKKRRNRDLTILMHLENHPNGQMVVIGNPSSQHEERNKLKLRIHGSAFGTCRDTDQKDLLTVIAVGSENRKCLEITLSYHNHSITLSLPFAFKTQKKVASGPYDTREIRFFRIVSKSAWFPCTTLVRFSTNNNGSAAMPNPTAIICNLLWCKCACHSRPAARLSSPKFNLLSH